MGGASRTTSAQSNDGLKSGSPLRVVQISDSHLYADESRELLGMNTQESFEAVLDLVKKEQSNIDLVLASGDVAQDASEAAYGRFGKAVETFGAPIYWLPGNHDSADTMQQLLPGSHLSPLCVDLGDWAMIGLDSSVKGEVAGALGQKQLDFLEQHLVKMADRHVIVTLHHHPVPVKSKWLDSVALKKPKSLWSVLNKHNNIKALVWGHVHQAYDKVHGGIRCFALPSTCIQFKPRTERFSLDTAPPGYRWFDLYPDGSIESQVSRVLDREFTVDLNGTGY